MGLVSINIINSKLLMENQILEQRISFKTSVLLKQKGFNQLCDQHYCYGSGDKEEPKIGETYIGGFYNEITGFQRQYRNSELVNWDLPYGEFSAPTQSILQRWLREIHGIEISLICFDGQYLKHVKQRPFKANTYNLDYFGTYEEVLEIALFEALNLIKTDL